MNSHAEALYRRWIELYDAGEPNQVRGGSVSRTLLKIATEHALMLLFRNPAAGGVFIIDEGIGIVQASDQTQRVLHQRSYCPRQEFGFDIGETVERTAFCPVQKISTCIGIKRRDVLDITNKVNISVGGDDPFRKHENLPMVFKRNRAGINDEQDVTIDSSAMLSAL